MSLHEIVVYVQSVPTLYGFVLGVCAAVAVDLRLFAATKEPGSFFSTFDFKVAGWRYLQGGVGGFLGAAGLASL